MVREFWDGGRSSGGVLAETNRAFFEMKTVLTCFALALTSLAGRSESVWSWPVTLESHGWQISTQERLWFWNASAGYKLFDNVSFSGADIGRTFSIASPADDADFLAAVRSLTDGNDDQIMILEGTSFLGGWTFGESTLFTNVPRAGPDLSGYRIDAITLTIDQLWIGRDYTVNPNASSPWTDTYGSATLSIEAVVIPEPSSACVGGIGLVVLGLLGRTRFADESRQPTPGERLGCNREPLARPG